MQNDNNLEDLRIFVSLNAKACLASAVFIRIVPIDSAKTASGPLMVDCIMAILFQITSTTDLLVLRYDENK